MTTYLRKSCSFCLPRVPFVNCRQFMYLAISLLVLRAGYGIWLYQFLIIAYLLLFVKCWPVQYPRIVMRKENLTGPARLLGSICPLRAPNGPVRLIVLVFPSTYRIRTVCTAMWTLYRIGSVKIRVYAFPRPKIIRTRKNPVKCIWPQHRTRVISLGLPWLQIPTGLGPHTGLLWPQRKSSFLDVF